MIDKERLCPECQKKLDERFEETKEYLNEHPDASMEELSRDLKISVKQIIRWIREERLVLSNPMSADITCESCGKPICSGRYCEKCKKRIASDLMEMSDRNKGGDKKGVGMRYLKL